MKPRVVYYWNEFTAQRIVCAIKWKFAFRFLKFVPVGIDDILLRLNPSQRMANVPEDHAVMIWGGGRSHDASYHFSPNAPYQKSVDDAHCDLYLHSGSFGDTPYNDLLTFANHNYFTLAMDPNALSLEVLGCNKDYAGRNGTGYEGKVKAKHDGEPEKPIVISPKIESSITGGIVHKSIDLDVAQGFPCEEVYRGQANEGVTMDSVISGLSSLMKKADVARLDIGGGDPELFFRHDCRMPKSYQRAQRRNAVRGYQIILELWLDS